MNHSHARPKKPPKRAKLLARRGATSASAEISTACCVAISVFLPSGASPVVHMTAAPEPRLYGAREPAVSAEAGGRPGVAYWTSKFRSATALELINVLSLTAAGKDHEMRYATRSVAAPVSAVPAEPANVDGIKASVPL
jgi:hypothetical protein